MKSLSVGIVAPESEPKVCTSTSNDVCGRSRCLTAKDAHTLLLGGANGLSFGVWVGQRSADMYVRGGRLRVCSKLVACSALLL
jgi:hypothetical protein